MGRPADPLITQFVLALAAETGAANNTCSAYRRDLELADRQLKGRGCFISAAGPDDFARLSERLDWQGFICAHAGRRLSALRHFMGWLVRDGIVRIIRHLLDALKLPQPLPKSLSETEMQLLLDACDKLPEPENIRIRAAVESSIPLVLEYQELLQLEVATMHAMTDSSADFWQGRGGAYGGAGGPGSRQPVIGWR